MADLAVDVNNNSAKIYHNADNITSNTYKIHYLADHVYNATNDVANIKVSTSDIQNIVV